MEVSKRISTRGSVTIPQQLRHAAGIAAGAPVDIEDAGDGLIIRKHVPSCRFCGSTVDVVSVWDNEICISCAQLLAIKAKDKLEAKNHG